mgnify:CR=1 FL=1
MFKRIVALSGFLLVVWLAFVLRQRAAALLPVDYDEDDYLGAAIHYAQALRQRDLAEIINYDFNYEHPPLIKLAYGLAILPLTPTEALPEKPANAPIASSLPQPHFQAARQLSVVFGALEVLVLALVNPLAGFFLAINTWQIKYTSQIMLESLPSLMSMLTVYFYLKSGRRLNFWLMLAALGLGLTVASKFPYGVVGIAVLAHWLWQDFPRNPDQDKIPWLRWLAPALLWGLLSVGFFFVANPRLWVDPLPRLWQAISFHGEYATSDYVRQAGYPFWQPLVWLFRSVPWHPGVFLISIDVFITIFAGLGFRRMWKEQPLFGLWLAIGIGFLLVWMTKWPQYILILTAPLSLSAAYGFRQTVWEPIRRLRITTKWASRQDLSRMRWLSGFRYLKTAIPWLLPGLVILGLIAGYPMLFQGAMALTDFSSTAIKDGLKGGVWREVWSGITGQVEPVQARIFQRSLSKEVHYSGPTLIFQLIDGAASELVVFGIIWMGLSLLSQTFLGLGAAWMLHQEGVRFKRLWRVIFILPWAIPEFVAALIWAQVFDPRFGWFTHAAKTWYETADYPGAVNFITQWQGNPTYALVVLLITATWYGFPFMMLAATAGMKLIPAEIYDAAAMDGAGTFKTFTLITLPLLKPLLIPAVIIRAIFSFNQFYIFLVLQPPFPLATFSVTSFNFFNQFGQYGASAAINLFAILILIGLIWWFSRWSRAVEGYTYA